MNNKEKGITLIALVITIIILIIITGVSVSNILNNDGIINKTIQVREKYSQSAAKECLELLKAPLYVEKHTLTIDDYLNVIEQKAEECDITSYEKIGENEAYIVVDGKYKFLAKNESNKDISITYLGESNELSISVKEATYTYPVAGTFIVTNNPSGGNLSVQSSNPDIATAEISGNIVTVTPGTTSGEAEIIVTSSANENYAESKAIHKATVENGEITLSATPYTGIYDNQEHPAFTTVTVNPSDAKVEYSLNGGAYTTTMPKVKGASEEGYTIAVKASKAGYTTETITETVIIGKQGNINGNLTLSETSGTLTYPNAGTFTITNNTSGGTLSVSSANTNIANVELSGNTVTVIPETTAGETTITVKSAATSNYEEQTATYTVTVENGEIIINETPYTGSYDGQNHQVFTVFTVNPSDAKVEYSLNGGAYTTTMPTVNGASTYTIAVKASKAGYTTESITETVIIGAKTIGNCSVTLGYTSTRYTGSALTPSVTVKDGSTTLTANTDYTVSYSNNVNVGTATVTVTGKGNYTGTKTANFTIEQPKQALTDVITAANYGDKVNYSVTVNRVTLNNWKIFYNDGSNVIMVYNDYLPNSTEIASNAGLATSGNYVVYSNTDRADLINKLTNQSNWTSLIRSDLAGKATAQGAVDLETWVASWNAKGYTRLYTATNSNGYYVGTSKNETSYYKYVSSNAGYNDKLYFPYNNTKGNCDGYWLASPSANGTSYVMDVDYSGSVNYSYYSFILNVDGVCPAVYLTSDVLTSGKDASGAWVIE